MTGVDFPHPWITPASIGGLSLSNVLLLVSENPTRCSILGTAARAPLGEFYGGKFSNKIKATGLDFEAKEILFYWENSPRHSVVTIMTVQDSLLSHKIRPV